MKKSYKIFLGIATIWPVLYIVFFVLSIFSFMFFLPFSQGRSHQEFESIDLIQLEQKIRNGELQSLTVRGSEIEAVDREGDRRYEVQVTNERTKGEIIRQATEVDASGKPRVGKVMEEPARELPAIFPIGFMGLFAVHILTIFLIMGLTAFYIYLAVKSDRLDQTMKIVWTILICMMGLLAMPVFWFLYVWREPPVADPESALAKS
jgi:hypothetical protein